MDEYKRMLFFLRVRNLACLTACLRRQTTSKLQFSALIYVFKTLIVVRKSSPTGLSKLGDHPMSCSINNQFSSVRDSWPFLCFFFFHCRHEKKKNSLLSWQFSPFSNHGWNGTQITSELKQFPLNLFQNWAPVRDHSAFRCSQCINTCVAYLYEGQKSAETPSKVIASPSDINLFKVIVLFCIV